MSLFKCVIRFSTQPKAFKTANVLIIPKNGKRDRIISRSYRLIVLLSCLGKGLERLIEWRLSYWAVKDMILTKDQCSAVKYQSETDLTMALNFDIRDAWNKKKVAGMNTVDMKGAFDGILCNFLLFQLQSQSWPKCIQPTPCQLNETYLKDLPCSQYFFFHT